jgi:hypothetical protein
MDDRWQREKSRGQKAEGRRQKAGDRENRGVYSRQRREDTGKRVAGRG